MVTVIVYGAQMLGVKNWLKSVNGSTAGGFDEIVVFIRRSERSP